MSEFDHDGAVDIGKIVDRLDDIEEALVCLRADPTILAAQIFRDWIQLQHGGNQFAAINDKPRVDLEAKRAISLAQSFYNAVDEIAERKGQTGG